MKGKCSVSCKQIRDLRLAKGWGLQQLADASGVGKTTLFEAENDMRDPRISTICSLAKALQCKPEELFVCLDKENDKQ